MINGAPFLLRSLYFFLLGSFVLPIFTIVLGYASLNIQIYQVSYAFFWRILNERSKYSDQDSFNSLEEYIYYYYSIIYYTCDCQRH